MPNCVDWEELPAVELQKRWLDLGTWVDKTLVRRLEYPVIWCWPHHPVVVDELKGLWCWHQEILHEDDSGPEELLRFHDAVRRVMSQWPKPCPKVGATTSREINARLLSADAELTATLLKDVAREHYLQRTRAVR